MTILYAKQTMKQRGEGGASALPRNAWFENSLAAALVKDWFEQHLVQKDGLFTDLIGG